MDDVRHAVRTSWECYLGNIFSVGQPCRGCAVASEQCLFAVPLRSCCVGFSLARWASAVDYPAVLSVLPWLHWRLCWCLSLSFGAPPANVVGRALCAFAVSQHLPWVFANLVSGHPGCSPTPVPFLGARFVA